MAVIFAAMAAHSGLFLAPWQHKTGVWQADALSPPLGLALNGPHFVVTDERSVLWRSEPGWRVQDYATGDINRDGADELLLLCWRRGNYGPSRPFWVERNDTDTFTQHLFIYAWDKGRAAVTPLWMSSRLAPMVRRWELTDDGRLHILTTEGEDTLWGWNSWGLVRLDGALLPL